MSASPRESAEAFLIVLKRLLKWASWGVAGLVVLGLAGWGISLAVDYSQKRPYAVKSYAGVTLGASQDEVLYALGSPSDVLVQAEDNPAEFGRKFRLRIALKDLTSGKTVNDYSRWVFDHERPNMKIDTEFDKPRGSLVSIGCFSIDSYNCPTIFGLRDGSSEEQVKDRLGVPASERIDGPAKILTYPAYNFTAYLAKKKLYYLRISEGAAPLLESN